MDNKHLERIGKLLRQAEKASTDDEAASYMAKAQMLSTQHAIDLEIARQHVASKEARKIPTIRRVTIGERGKRLLATYCQLYLAIAAANDVKCDLAHNSTYVIAYGFESDIDVVDALYMSLVTQMVEASTAYLRTGEYKQETVERAVYKGGWWDYEEKPVSGITARKSFQEAFARRVGTRLSMARIEAIEAMKSAESIHNVDPADIMNVEASAATGTELVLVTKQLEIKDFYRANSNARGSWRGGRSTGARSNYASSAGREAGERARLGGERSIGGGSRALTS
jgi:hypothetical protein